MNKQKGSALTEVMIAFILIALAVVIITPMFSVGIKNSKIPKEKTLATNIAREMIENIQSKGFTYLYPRINESNPTPAPDKGENYGNVPFIYPNKGLILYTNRDEGANCNNPAVCKPLYITTTYAFDKGTDTGSAVDDSINVMVQIIVLPVKDNETVTITGDKEIIVTKENGSTAMYTLNGNVTINDERSVTHRITMSTKLIRNQL